MPKGSDAMASRDAVTTALCPPSEITVKVRTKPETGASAARWSAHYVRNLRSTFVRIRRLNNHQ